MLAEERRRHVARLLVRGLTVLEVTKAMATDLGQVNPETSQPWSFETIRLDYRFLKRQWRKEAAADTSDHLGRMLAELAEVKRRCWTDGDMKGVLNALRQEASIKGLNAPVKVASTDSQGKDVPPLSDHERRAHIEAIVRQAEAMNGPSTPTAAPE